MSCRNNRPLTLPRALRGLLVFALCASLPLEAAPADSLRPRTAVRCTHLNVRQFPDSRIEDLAKAGVDLIVLDASGRDILVSPSGQAATTNMIFDFSLLDREIARWSGKGIHLILEISLGNSFAKESGCYADYLNENGVRISGRPNVYLPATETLYASFIGGVVSHYDTNSAVYGFYLEGPSYFGEMEMITDNYANPTFFAYDEHAKAAFQSYLAKAYGDIGALNSAWATAYCSFGDVAVPKPNYSLRNDQVDARQSWSDLVMFRYQYLNAVLRCWLHAAAVHTTKPVGFMVGGAKMGGAKSGPFAISLGTMLKILGEERHASIYDDTDAESLASLKYSVAGASQYGIEFHGEQDGDWPSSPTYDERQCLATVLMSGAPLRLYSHLAQLFGGFDGGWQGSCPETRNFRELKEAIVTFRACRPTPVRSDVAFFHSSFTSWYRGGYNNDDICRIYDAELTHPAYRSFASWQRYLTSPDVIDEQLILDGALKNYKVLVIPNTSATVTLETVGAKIKQWVKEGGCLAAFGSGALTCSIDNSRRLVSSRPNDPAAWCLGLSGGTAAEATNASNVTWRVASNKPRWLRSVDAPGLIPRVEKAFTALAAGTTPVLEDGNGRPFLVESAYGAGRTLFCATPIEENHFFQAIIPRILSDFADSRSVRRDIRYDPTVAAAYAGTNQIDHKRLVIVYEGKTGRLGTEGRIDVDPAVGGEVEIVRIERRGQQ